MLKCWQLFFISILALHVTGAVLADDFYLVLQNHFDGFGDSGFKNPSFRAPKGIIARVIEYKRLRTTESAVKIRIEGCDKKLYGLQDIIPCTGFIGSEVWVKRTPTNAADAVIYRIDTNNGVFIKTDEAELVQTMAAPKPIKLTHVALTTIPIAAKRVEASLDPATEQKNPLECKEQALGFDQALRLSKPLDPADVKCSAPSADCVADRARPYMQNELNALLIKTANVFGVDPALMKAIIHAETMPPMNPFSTYTETKGAYKGRQSRGLSQFILPETAREYGMDFDAAVPAECQGDVAKKVYQRSAACREAVWSEKYFKESQKQVGRSILCSIWSPQCHVAALAKKLRNELDKKHHIALPDGRKVRVDLLFTSKNASAAERTRYLASIHNRDSRWLKSVRAHFNQTGEIPVEYAQAWFTPTEGGLNSEKINRCYVYKIAGLCGDKPQGLLKIYSQDFELKGRPELWCTK